MFRPYFASPPSAARSAVAAEVLAAAQAGVDELCSQLHRPALTMRDALQGHEKLRLAFIPRSFQDGADLFDDTNLFVGPSLKLPAEVNWPFDVQDGCKPLRAYISLGTLRNAKPDFYRMCFEAFGADEWEVVMSVGTKIEVGSLGPIPPNFSVHAAVPQLAVLRHTDVFVTHGGLNSVMEAAWSGVPLVAVPEIAEQRRTADRIASLGLGVSLDSATLTSRTLRAAAREVVLDHSVRENVQAMQRDAIAAGGASRAADTLIDFALVRKLKKEL